MTDSELLAVDPIIIEPGTVDSSGIIRNQHLRNPFAESDPDLARRWSALHWSSKPAVEEAPTDPFDALREQLATLDGGKLFFSPENGLGLGCHPIQSSDTAGWEREAIAQNEVAMALEASTRPVEKPQAETLRRVARGD